MIGPYSCTRAESAIASIAKVNANPPQRQRIARVCRAKDRLDENGLGDWKRFSASKARPHKRARQAAAFSAAFLPAVRLS
jgi:hypothetical protein